MAKFLTRPGEAVRVSEISDVQVRRETRGWTVYLYTKKEKPLVIVSVDRPITTLRVMRMLEIAEAAEGYSVRWEDLVTATIENSFRNPELDVQALKVFYESLSHVKELLVRNNQVLSEKIDSAGRIESLTFYADSEAALNSKCGGADEEVVTLTYLDFHNDAGLRTDHS